MKSVVLGADLHVLEAVAQVAVAQFVQPHGLGVVGRDGHHGDLLVLVVRRKLLDAVLVGLGRGTVVAGEDDDQDLGVAERLQAVGLAVHAGQAEIGCRAADLQRVGMTDGQAARKRPKEAPRRRQKYDGGGGFGTLVVSSDARGSTSCTVLPGRTSRGFSSRLGRLVRDGCGIPDSSQYAPASCPRTAPPAAATLFRPVPCVQPTPPPAFDHRRRSCGGCAESAP